MADLTKDEVRAMGKAVGLDIQDPELTEVMYSINALLEALDGINPPAGRASSRCRLSCPRGSNLELFTSIPAFPHRRVRGCVKVTSMRMGFATRVFNSRI